MYHAVVLPLPYESTVNAVAMEKIVAPESPRRLRDLLLPAPESIHLSLRIIILLAQLLLVDASTPCPAICGLRSPASAARTSLRLLPTALALSLRLLTHHIGEGRHVAEVTLGKALATNAGHLARLLDILLQLEDLAHLAEEERVLAQRELEVLVLDLLPARVVRRARRLECQTLDKLGGNLIDYSHSLGERVARVAAAIEELRYCTEALSLVARSSCQYGPGVCGGILTFSKGEVHLPDIFAGASSNLHLDWLT